ncbi:type II secretion system protein GspM [Salinispirillum marinum]|uniref:Type II secretion system protein M n=2 Tax=Saccharospirillaceae TaxID=255527 RepID=A0ABV8BFD3_9GAMM
MNAIWATLVQRWQQYSRSEQLIVAGIGSVTVLVLSWLMLWQPLMDWQARVARDHQVATESLSWLSDVAPRVRNMGSPSTEVEANNPQSLTNLISESARQNNLSLSRFEQNGPQGLRFWLDNQRFDHALRWMSDLEGQGLLLDQITISQTSRAGLVNIRGVAQRR